MAEPLDLEAADRAIAWFNGELASATDTALTQPDLRFNALCFLKYRYVPSDPEAAYERLAKDLQRWEDSGTPPKWMPTGLLEEASKPGFLAPGP